MSAQLTRQELIRLVTRVMNVDGTETEIDELLQLLERNVPHPEVSDLIFYPDREMTAEEVVDRALAHKPIHLN